MKRSDTPETFDTTRSIAYRYAQASHRGLVREQNEDAVAVVEDAGLALIADGMGGYNAGEVASGMAVEFLVNHLVDDLKRWHGSSSGGKRGHSHHLLHALLRTRIDGLNEAIIDAANRTPDYYGMGTTLALLVFAEGTVTTLHLGDSRIYRLRDDELGLLTRDHSLLQEQIDAGLLTPAEARMSVNRNFVTRALGVDIDAEPEISQFDLAAGDLYLICSDGLPDMLTDEEIFDLLRGDIADDDAESEFSPDREVADQDFLEDIATRLVDAANGRGGRDNVSVVLASVGWARESELPA